jgi:outer membrane protein assembly factor BamE (lipoprotein component of BamABCDE complex)
MTLELISSTPRLLLAAGLFLGAAAAQAASGFTVNPSQQALVTPGMSAAEVQSALGRPARNIKYVNQPGPTFTYLVIGKKDTLFDVDFGADGKVTSLSERMKNELDGHGGRDDNR